MSEPTTTTVDVNGHPCRVWTKGSGPKIGFLAGFGGLPRWIPFLDRLAEKPGISGLEIRRRNVITPGAVWGPGQIMDDGCLGAARCLDAATSAATAAVIFTTVPPAKSCRPIAPSHPPPQTQWHTGEYTTSSHRALNISIAEKRIRSANAPAISAGVIMANVIW